jgi:glycosyltransferase involved in cell wall biosynthesis
MDEKHCLMKPDWICCQLGAREHYAIPRALHQRGALNTLFTDTWVKPKSPLGYIKRSLGERYHSQLADACVKSTIPASLMFETWGRINRLTGWNQTIARNEWFQRLAVKALSKQLRANRGTLPNQPVLFAYSYAARDIFRWAKLQGWKTVLGQIDAGPEMGRIIDEQNKKHFEYQSRCSPPPSRYWEAWHEECVLADKIIVNSNWSRQALMQVNIPDEKIKVVPLAFERPKEATGFQRVYPESFSETRPMRVLFLGQVTLLKGIATLLEAVELLREQPIEFRIVGPNQVKIPEMFLKHPKIKWEGLVPRSAAAAFYRESDVFLFPTHCDGFGLTQLEAQAWRLPVVATGYCGDVVCDRVNGLRMPCDDSHAITAALVECVNKPVLLSEFAQRAVSSETFNLAKLSDNLFEIERD